MAIELTGLCQSLGVLPRGGGLLDQDSYHVYMMQCVLSAQAEKANRDQAAQEVSMSQRQQQRLWM